MCGMAPSYAGIFFYQYNLYACCRGNTVDHKEEKQQRNDDNDNVHGADRNLVGKPIIQFISFFSG